MLEADRQQLDELYRFQADAVRRTLTHKVGREAAEDIVSRAVVRLAERMMREPVKDAPALFGLITAQLLKNHYRDEDTRREHELTAGDDLVPLADAAHSHFGLTQDTHDFDTAFDVSLRGLEDDDRSAFILTELRGLSIREAADALSTPKSVIHRRAEQARISIREELLAA